MGTKHTLGNHTAGRMFIRSENITQFTLTPTRYESYLAPVAFSVYSFILPIQSLNTLHLYYRASRMVVVLLSQIDLSFTLTIKCTKAKE